MKSKVLVFLVVLFLGSFLQVSAEYVPVELLNTVNVQNHSGIFSVKALSDIWISDFHKIEKGAIVKGQINKIVPPRRLERDAYIVFVPVCYTVPSEKDKEVQIPNPSNSKMRPARNIDKKDVATNTVGTVLSNVPPFNIILPVVQFGIGAATPKKGEHRLRSGCRAIIEGWPLCYCLKGKEIPITAGAVLEISFTEKLFEAKTSKPETL